MSLCWLAPAQRPSLRELRIMLLHLRSSRDELEAADFDRRWNQLMPRSPAAIATTLPSVMTSTHDDEEAEMSFSLAPSALPKRNPADVHGLASPGITAIVRPASLDSELSSEFTASMLAEAGSRQVSFSMSPGNTPDDVTLDDSFIGMAQRFSFPGNDRSLTAPLSTTMNSSSAFEMVSYSKAQEVEVTESKNEINADVEVNESVDIKKNPPSTIGTNTVTTEEAGSQETVKDNFDSGEEDWQHYSDSSASQNVNNLADQKSEQVSTMEAVTVSVSVSDKNDVGSIDQEDAVNVMAVANDNSTECNVGNTEEQDSKDGSFCMLKVSVDEIDSPTKSLDVDSPVKSTTSSADWCLVSNHTEQSREEELDAVSQVTDPSLPGDCVLVESKARVGEEDSPEDISNTNTAATQENASDCNMTSTVDKDQPIDSTAD